jgi:predicted esterase
MTPEPLLHLVKRHPVVAESAIFDGAIFPRIDFLNPDLVRAALGAYTIKVRYFNAGWNELRVPRAPGRYGARVEINLPDGTSETRNLTLFKTAAPYRPAHDPYDFVARFPAAFGLSSEAVARGHSNANALLNRIVGTSGNELAAVLAAVLHDLAADPARWQGFNYWHIEETWWTGLEETLGLSPDYNRLVHLPENYESDAAARWPLLLFLHGTYECGNDLEKLRDQGPLGYARQGHALPFILVFPQCPEQHSWNPAKLMRLIETIEAEYRVDPRRIYVTGLSMGGFSTFDLGALYPDRIAAIAPLSAGENPDIAERLKTVPVWIFHGAEDPIVSPRDSIEIAARLVKMGGEAKITVLPGVGHEGWDKLYADPALYTWFLGHTLKS